MPQVSQAFRRGPAGPRIVQLALIASGAACATLAIVWQHAQGYGAPRPGEGATLAQTALRAHGLAWARVTERDGVVNIAGAAPSEAARVIAYRATRRALRPLMGRDATITGIRSIVVLRGNPEPFGRKPLSPSLDIASLTPPPTPLIHETVAQAVMAPPAAPDEEPQAGMPSTHRSVSHQDIETGAVTRAHGGGDQHTIDSDDSAAMSPVSEAPQLAAQEPEPAALETVREADPVATPVEPAEQPHTEAAARDAAPPSTMETDTSAAMTAPFEAPQPPAQEQAALDTDGESAPAIVPAEQTEQTPAQTAVLVADHEPAQVAAPAGQTEPAPTGIAALYADAAPQAGDCADAFAETLEGTTINFARASAVIQKESRPLLDKLASIAKRCKGYRFTVEGHTDLTGSRAANLTLSKKRAEAVRWALIDRGIDMDHIAAEGFGASRPLENATSDEANAKNRRIAVTVSAGRQPASAGRDQIRNRVIEVNGRK
jgi:outer membrane protein OmpA-like peptidoglycan-associated protein